MRYKIPQVYLARTASVQKVRWDEHIRMVDHKDFFSRASGRLVVVLDTGNHVYHARTPFDAEYIRYREDTQADLVYLADKWGERARGAGSTGEQ